MNGVDIIRCNDAGKIVEFRVMIRPLQAINLVHRQMGEMLEKLEIDPIRTARSGDSWATRA